MNIPKNVKLEKNGIHTATALYIVKVVLIDGKKWQENEVGEDNSYRTFSEIWVENQKQNFLEIAVKTFRVTCHCGAEN